MTAMTHGPLDARAATRCPVRVQYDLLPPAGAIRDESSKTAIERGEEALVHRRDVLAELIAFHPQAVDIGPGSEAVHRTLQAAANGSPLILTPTLPQDLGGGRIGSPPALLRVGVGYVPIEIRLHGAIEPDAKKSVLVSTLVNPESVQERTGFGWKASRLREDALPLAHYWRMLEHAGLASDSPRGIVIDRSREMVWIDLAEAGEKVSWSDLKVSLQEVYDHEFELRRQVAAHTHDRLDDASLPRKVLPLAIAECATCHWNTVCSAELEDLDHISLLPGFRADWYDAFKERGVTSRHALAGLDPFTAAVLSGLTGPMLKKVESAALDDSLAHLLPNRPAVVAECAEAGIITAADLLARLDPATLAFRTARVGTLGTHVDLARAIVSGGYHRQRSVGSLTLESPAIEVDVDMESSSTQHNYLWGALPVVEGILGEYQFFDSYEEMSDRAEAEVFLRFWGWLGEQRAKAVALGGSLRIYHWTPVELAAMRKIVRLAAHPGLPTPDELSDVLREEWIDLSTIWTNHVLTGMGRSLKPVAKSIGFRWDVDDPGGDLSMLQHRIAVGGSTAEREEAIVWLRRYNGSDVRATYEVREWLRANFSRLPRIEDWDDSRQR